MKHFDRVYLHGDHSVDMVALFIDMGSGGFNRVVVDPSTISPNELFVLNYYASCLFKLPANGYAVVDVYVEHGPKQFGKRFNYQVFRSKNHSFDKEKFRDQLAQLQKKLREAMVNVSQSESKSDSYGPAETGGSGIQARCTAMEPCNGVMEIDCDDPLTTVAVCDVADGLKCGPGDPPG